MRLNTTSLNQVMVAPDAIELLLSRDKGGKSPSPMDEDDFKKALPVVIVVDVPTPPVPAFDAPPPLTLPPSSSASGSREES